MSDRINVPRFAHSLAFLESPWTMAMRTMLWLSSVVVKILEAFVGMEVFRSMMVETLMLKTGEKREVFVRKKKIHEILKKFRANNRELFRPFPLDAR